MFKLLRFFAGDILVLPLQLIYQTDRGILPVTVYIIGNDFFTEIMISAIVTGEMLLSLRPVVSGKA